MVVTNATIHQFNLERDRSFLMTNMASQPFLAMSKVLDKHFLSLTESNGPTVLIMVGLLLPLLLFHPLVNTWTQQVQSGMERPTNSISDGDTPVVV